MWKGYSLLRDLFFVILICAIGFLVHLKIVDDDQYNCTKEIEIWMEKVLEYQKNLWGIRIPASLKWINLSRFNIDLNNIKVSDIEMEWTTTTFEKMHYSWTKRIYDAVVWVKMRYSELQDFNLNIPITCTIENGQTNIEYREKSK